jgi:hypothetical protein
MRCRTTPTCARRSTSCRSARRTRCSWRATGTAGGQQRQAAGAQQTQQAQQREQQAVQQGLQEVDQLCAQLKATRHRLRPHRGAAAARGQGSARTCRPISGKTQSRLSTICSSGLPHRRARSTTRRPAGGGVLRPTGSGAPGRRRRPCTKRCGAPRADVASAVRRSRARHGERTAKRAAVGPDRLGHVDATRIRRPHGAASRCALPTHAHRSGTMPFTRKTSPTPARSASTSSWPTTRSTRSPWSARCSRPSGQEEGSPGAKQYVVGTAPQVVRLQLPVVQRLAGRDVQPSPDHRAGELPVALVPRRLRARRGSPGAERHHRHRRRQQGHQRVRRREDPAHVAHRRAVRIAQAGLPGAVLLPGPPGRHAVDRRHRRPGRPDLADAHRGHRRRHRPLGRGERLLAQQRVHGPDDHDHDRHHPEPDGSQLPPVHAQRRPARPAHRRLDVHRRLPQLRADDLRPHGLRSVEHEEGGRGRHQDADVPRHRAAVVAGVPGARLAFRAGHAVGEALLLHQHEHARLRPLQGHDTVSRKPPRAYDRYEYYWAITWRGA